jgi:hypothetical protein
MKMTLSKQVNPIYFLIAIAKSAMRGLNGYARISDDLNVISKIGFCVSRFTGVPQHICKNSGREKYSYACFKKVSHKRCFVLVNVESAGG